jgi:3',5'-cyclic AMP phosphodiesterase CpdA
MIDLANALDNHTHRDEITLIGTIHHHPVPVDRPERYAAPFYERILGQSFEKTDALEDAGAFMQFAREQRVAAILHGHKHIPRLVIDAASGLPIVGCGSSVGKIETRDGTPYLSVNVLTVDPGQGRLSARLLASRAAGGRLEQQTSHQAVLVSAL